MTEKPTYKELERRVKGLEKEVGKRKKADRIHYQSKKTYQNILNHIIEGYYEVDLRGNLTFFNDSLCKIYGYARDELMGMNNRNYMTTETAKKAYEIFNRVYKTGKPTKIFDWKFIKKDGTEVDVEISVSLIRNPKGQAIGFRGIVRDIRERKLAQEELVKSKSMFQAIVESLPFDIFALDLNNRYILQNSICRKNWGDLIGKFPENVAVDKNTKDLWLKNNRLAFSGETIKGEVIYHRLNRDKSYYYNIISPIIDKEKIFGILGVLIDITEIKRVEEDLRISKEQFRNLTETTSDWVWEVDKDSRYTYVNPKIQDILGYYPEEIIGKTPFDLMPPDEDLRVSKIFNSIAESKQPFHCLENINLHKKGHPVVLETSGIPIFDDDGEICGYRGVDRDITERKRIQEELQKAYDELENRVEERTRELVIQKSNLEEANIALQVLLDKRQEDKKELEDNVLTNVKEMTAPYFEKIRKTKLNDQQKAILRILESYLNEIISPFARKMSMKYINLTPTEIHVANLIRHGINSKDIAEIMGLSPQTIYNHRKNIRKKFGLERKKTNLRSHLLSIN